MNSHSTRNAVKERVAVENLGSRMSRHKLWTSGSIVKPLHPVCADKLRLMVGGSELVKGLDR